MGSKKRTSRMQTKPPPPADSPAAEQGQQQEKVADLPLDCPAAPSVDSKVVERAQLELSQASMERAAQLRAAQLKPNDAPEPAMLTTETMPGSIIIEPPPPPRSVEPQPPTVAQFEGSQIGQQVRDVELTRGYAPVVKLAITFEPQANYIIEFVDGRARVPQRIADYIQRENPGNCMRVV
jgi:hypothetical protein